MRGETKDKWNGKIVDRWKGKMIKGSIGERLLEENELRNHKEVVSVGKKRKEKFCVGERMITKTREREGVHSHQSFAIWSGSF